MNENNLMMVVQFAHAGLVQAHDAGVGEPVEDLTRGARIRRVGRLSRILVEF